MLAINADGEAMLSFPIWRVCWLEGLNCILASSAIDNRIVLYSVEDRALYNPSSLPKAKLDLAIVSDIDFDPSRNILSLCHTNQIRETYTITIDSNRVLKAFPQPSSDPSSSSSFRHLGKRYLFSSFPDSCTYLCDSTHRRVGSSWWSQRIITHPEGLILALVVNDQGGGRVNFIYAANNLQSFSLQFEAFPQIAGFSFSADGEKFGVVCGAVVSGRSCLEFRLHDFPSCSLLWKHDLSCSDSIPPSWYSPVHHHPFPTESFVLNSDGSKVIFPTIDGDLLEFDTRRDIALKRLALHRDLVTTSSIDYNTGLLVTGCAGGCVATWQLDKSYLQPELKLSMVSQRFLETYRTVPSFAFEPDLYCTDGEFRFGRP